MFDKIFKKKAKTKDDAAETASGEAINFNQVKKNPGKSVVASSVLNSGNMGRLTMNKQQQKQLLEDRKKIPVYVTGLKYFSLVFLALTFLVIAWTTMDGDRKNSYLKYLAQSNTGEKYSTLNVAKSTLSEEVQILNKEIENLEYRVKNKKFFQYQDLIDSIKSQQKNWFVALDQFRYVIYDKNEKDLNKKHNESVLYPPLGDEADNTIYWFSQNLITGNDKDEKTIITLQTVQNKPQQKIYKIADADAPLEGLKEEIKKARNFEADESLNETFRQIELPTPEDESLNSEKFVMEPVFVGYGLIDLFLPSNHSFDFYFLSDDYRILYLKENINSSDTESNQLISSQQVVKIDEIAISEQNVNLNVQLTNYKPKKFTYAADLVQVANSIPIFNGAEIRNFSIQETDNNAEGIVFPVRLSQQDLNLHDTDDRFRVHFENWFLTEYQRTNGSISEKSTETETQTQSKPTTSKPSRSTRPTPKSSLLDDF